ncbi:MAG TPA: erythromycin esterase family protein [Longimicrobiaceae bacterium]
MFARLRPPAVAMAVLALAAACSDAPTGPQSTGSGETEMLAAITAAATPLTGAVADYDPLLALTAGAGYVLLGEQTHGTHEFYRERGRITRRLAGEQGFTAIAVEADWPEAERVNAYVRGYGSDATAEQALGNFSTFPTWMWANTDVRDLVGWLRQRNAGMPDAQRAGFYGLDLQAMFEAADAVERYLQQVDPAAADRARQRYACFDPFRDDPAETYGKAAAADPRRACEQRVAEELSEMEARYAAAPATDAAALDALFSALMNARAVERGEAYYRAWAMGGPEAWNLRDENMARTLDRIVAHGKRLGRAVKVVVWAHNTHVGDLRATLDAATGSVNLGMLMRQQHPGRVVLAGFSTFRGTVMAARAWGGAGAEFPLVAAAPGSDVELLHRAVPGDFLLVLRGRAELAAPFSEFRTQRAVGVVFDPDWERNSNYFRAKLADQFDAVVHVDQTTAVDPL